MLCPIAMHVAQLLPTQKYLQGLEACVVVAPRLARLGLVPSPKIDSVGAAEVKQCSSTIPQRTRGILSDAPLPSVRGVGFPSASLSGKLFDFAGDFTS